MTQVLLYALLGLGSGAYAQAGEQAPPIQSGSKLPHSKASRPHKVTVGRTGPLVGADPGRNGA